MTPNQNNQPAPYFPPQGTPAPYGYNQPGPWQQQQPQWYWTPQVQPAHPNNGAGVVGLVLSIIGLFIPFVSLIAIPFAAVGVSRVRSKQANNKGSAITGLLLSILGCLWIVVLFAL
ncbi:DUF4190 domain-containing protein [Amycolatopsis acidicola]|uniref:DUF4190 domain-containing protein n=1 Tax=Amycolatopsis acidicola TaxID=2596893 RepID=A0A5N0UTG7_9PSEU|nr:DUF4190 domain-containing protein [Amycolatopsis acidicola]KAA9155527.1 DUF4190 domain-containing protein [Amycolatopsis acidicola]